MRFLLPFGCCLVVATALADGPPPDQGDRLALEAARADAGWKAERVRVTLSIEGASRSQATRVFSLLRVEGTKAGDGERSLVSLEEPARHRGLRILTIAQPSGGDEVWLHLPKHRRTRRIAGRKRSGRFLGSDLTYEDLGSRAPSRYTHRHLRDELFKGVKTYVLEAVPKDPDSGYVRILLRRQAGDHRLLEVRYHAQAGETPQKVGKFSEFRKIGGHWRPGRLVITHTDTGRRTVLRFEGYELGLDVPEDAVSRRSLER